MVPTGSPPRVRSRRTQVPPEPSESGITSACAEQTPASRTLRVPTWDHLRVCGADSACVIPAATAADHLRVCGADEGQTGIVNGELGSPPRVRSRLLYETFRNYDDGITSACAEQTIVVLSSVSVHQDHLRVCGADPPSRRIRRPQRGSPPRVRSRPPPRRLHNPMAGITSACAEQTSWARWPCRRTWDHLRVCGADIPPVCVWGWLSGSPPRVRSRLPVGHGACVLGGITSACAEQTILRRSGWLGWGDHLRVCGADYFRKLARLTLSGSPPRVRSRHSGYLQHVWFGGITSACAEQTSISRLAGSSIRDHLRVCGADKRMRMACLIGLGSPPRVRSRLRLEPPDRLCDGITSACAEQTAVAVTGITVFGDHLRVCGADEVDLFEAMCHQGSPPRVRSRPCRLMLPLRSAGITSACAEQTCFPT